MVVAEEGNTLGRGVGCADGVGLSVGCADGIGVGWTLGIAVLGLAVGLPGKGVGLSVGWVVGSLLGLFVGCGDGEVEGDMLLGENDGIIVGRYDGA